MKKTFISALVMVTLTCSLCAQAPNAFNYQAVARDASGNAITNHAISVEISIRDGSPTASIVYQEIDTASTNQFGLFTVSIGLGQVQVGTFASINWPTGNKYLQVGFDPAGGASFSNMGTAQLLSVPYALYAQSSNTGGGITHYIGELYGGGIVISVWKDTLGVEHGLVASSADVGAGSQWSNVNSTSIGASAESTSVGSANTAAIIAQSGETSSAASLCASYNGGGYTDWYLPAMWELQQCYSQAAIINNILGGTNGFQSVSYWSSTETGASSAWGLAFNNGGLSNGGAKDYSYNVRAVRKY